MGYVTVTESVGEVMKTYHFSSYEDFKDWENKISGVVVSADHLNFGGDIWIKNIGKQPSIDGKTYVEVEFLDGGTCVDCVDAWIWEKRGGCSDIVKYRVVSK